MLSDHTFRSHESIADFHCVLFGLQMLFRKVRVLRSILELGTDTYTFESQSSELEGPDDCTL